jgi:hypothetical protein
MSESTVRTARSCQDCGQAITPSDQVRWECECGIFVCGEAACFEEYFKTVGGGEGVRCRTCGHIT